MLNDTMIELESAAKALDLSDVSTAAVCLRKALEGHVRMEPRTATPDPHAVDPEAQLAKAIQALESKEFSLAGLCCDKAARGLADLLPEALHGALNGAAQALRNQDLTSLASHLRVMVRYFRPDLTTPAPAPVPNVEVSNLAPSASAATPPDLTATPTASEVITLPVTQAVIP